MKISWPEFLNLVAGDREKILSLLWVTDPAIAASFAADLTILGLQQGDSEALAQVRRTAKRMDKAGTQARCDLCGKRARWFHHKLCPRCWQRMG